MLFEPNTFIDEAVFLMKLWTGINGDPLNLADNRPFLMPSVLDEVKVLPKEDADET